MPDPFIGDIINPSDAHTLFADDFTLAGVAVLILGNGHMGLRANDECTPILMGWGEWIDERGIKDITAYIKANLNRIADVLDTVMIGRVEDRADVEAMLARLPEDQRQAWLDERHERRRTSMNDITGRARQVAVNSRRRAREFAEGKDTTDE